MRNLHRVDLVSSTLTNKANRNKGLTVAELAKLTDIPKTSVKTILRLPGFSRAEFPRWPYSYYYSGGTAASIASVNKPTKSIDKETTNVPKNFKDLLPFIQTEPLDCPVGYVIQPPHPMPLDPKRRQEAIDKLPELTTQLSEFLQATVVNLNKMAANVATFKSDNKPLPKAEWQAYLHTMTRARQGSIVMAAVLNVILCDPRITLPEYFDAFSVAPYPNETNETDGN